MKLDLDRVLKVLILSDICVVSGFGLLSPIFALFVTKQIAGGTIEAVGLAAALYILTKSLSQIPIAKFSDQHHSRRIGTLLFGTLIMALVPFVYLSASRIEHIFVAQILYGLGAGASYPAWMAMFSHHLDKGKEGFEWGVYSTIMGICTAVVAIVGAVIAQTYGYATLFKVVGSLTVAGFLIMLICLDFKTEKKILKGLIHCREKLVHMHQSHHH